MVRNALLLVIALLLAGCAGMRTQLVSEREREERQVIQLIDYAQRVATMTAEQQRRQYSEGDQDFARNKDTMSRMRLALLLATPGASIHDAARAASLLEPMTAPQDGTSPLRALARLLYMQLTERASEQKRANQMREQFENRKDAERGLREQLEARKDAERTLREQLEALKEVERTILQRGQESQPRRR